MAVSQMSVLAVFRKVTFKRTHAWLLCKACWMHTLPLRLSADQAQMSSSTNAMQGMATCGHMCACSTPAGEAHHSPTQPMDLQQTMAMTPSVSSPGLPAIGAPNRACDLVSCVFGPWSTPCTWCCTSSGGVEGVHGNFVVLT